VPTPTLVPLLAADIALCEGDLSTDR